MPELYSVSSDWSEYCFIYDSLLLVESFDLCKKNAGGISLLLQQRGKKEGMPERQNK
jgi:hypothetical protein